MEIIPDSDLLGFEPRLETVQFVKSYETTYETETLESPAADLRDLFRKIAQDVNRKMQITWRDKQWPKHKPTGNKIVTQPGYQPEDYDFLESSEYDVDFVVMLVKSLDEIGPELGRILLRSRESYYHTFVVSLDSYPQTELEEHRDALDKIPTSSVANNQDQHHILMPQINERSRFDSLSPMKQGLLSVQEFERLNIEQIRGQLTYMTINKLGKADIMNNKRKPESPDDTKPSTHDEGEEWKPEGWEPDNN